jgi:hypothetical protein
MCMQHGHDHPAIWASIAHQDHVAIGQRHASPLRSPFLICGNQSRSLPPYLDMTLESPSRHRGGRGASFLPL